MITAFNDEGSTEHTSKRARLASPDIENTDQSADDESDNDLQLSGAASSSKQGGVTSRTSMTLICAVRMSTQVLTRNVGACT
jgi:hypothetical protein